MDDILKSIGFTAKNCLVSNDIIDLLNTLYNDKTTYLSLLPSEIFKVIIENLYINLEFNYCLNILHQQILNSYHMSGSNNHHIYI